MNKMNKTNGLATFFLVALFLIGSDTGIVNAQNRTGESRKSIKMAILLDTSNSMDGLIDQAKSQLWSIVNEMAKAKCDNTRANVQIALYEYGNSGLPMSEGYIRMVTSLTDDLDQISEDLFALRTNGGQEYCGQVIKTALNELDWSKSSNDFQTIYIAGNEPFTQGNVDYRNICREARERGIVVNTIFCGDFNEGIRGSWKDGALLTNGDYFSIEQDRKTVYIESPWDQQIINLNNKLNGTYIYYGNKGLKKKEMQEMQDANAMSYGAPNAVQRAAVKSSHVYKNSSWDLVDATEEADFELGEVEEEFLPEEMKGKSENEKTAFIEEKKTERMEIQKEIQELNAKREKYIIQQRHNNNNQAMLDNAIVNSVKNQASGKNFVFE